MMACGLQRTVARRALTAEHAGAHRRRSGGNRRHAHGGSGGASGTRREVAVPMAGGWRRADLEEEAAADWKARAEGRQESEMSGIQRMTSCMKISSIGSRYIGIPKMSN